MTDHREATEREAADAESVRPASASASALLTTFCGVCRAVPPLYRCPRCALRYCSVACSRRHRVRAGCSGIRDVTAYVPRARLCTPAGIDHDYNFLHGIELARRRNERLLVDERRLLRRADLRPRVVGEGGSQGGRGGRGGQGGRQPRGPKHMGHMGTLDAWEGGGGERSSLVLQREWHGPELRFVPAGGAGGAGLPGTGLTGGTATHTTGSKKVRALCQRDDIVLLSVPTGLARQRENNTTVATLHGGGRDKGDKGDKGDREKRGEMHLHWQVEWLVYEAADGVAGRPTRILRRLLDDVPLHRGYASLMAYVQTGGWVDSREEDDNDKEDREDRGPSSERKRRAVAPSPLALLPKRLMPPAKKRRTERAATTTAAASFSCVYAWQDPRGAWGQRGREPKPDPGEPEPEPEPEDEAARRRLRFFLLQARLPTADPPYSRPPGKALIPLDPADTLATALRGRSVVEFPTIYVLPPARYGHVGQDGQDGEGHDLPPKHVLGSTERRAAVESETSSSGTSSSSEEEDDNEDEDDEDDEDGEAASAGANGIDSAQEVALPPLTDIRRAASRPLADGAAASKLVVYDSWSEGSGDEGHS